MQILLSSVANGERGFKLIGETSNDYARSIAGAGDVNGDGLDDILVGAWAHSVTGHYDGAAYVVYGGIAATAPINLTTVSAGDGGFKIIGQDNENFGEAVAPAGDLDGDGHADLLIGAPNSSDWKGGAYVVFGGDRNGELVQASDVAAGQGGYVINSPSPSGYATGLWLDLAGDVNGDGRADLVIGDYSGNAYVVFTGDAPPDSPISLTAVAAGQGGFVIGAEAGYNDWPGMNVAGAGDVNGDGLADLLIGLPFDGRTGPEGDYPFSGAAYVAYGKADGTPIHYDQLAMGNGGFRILGEQPGDFVGNAISAAGDVNNDGFADLLIGTYADDLGGADVGAAYVVYGGPKLAPTIDLRDVALGLGGFKIVGEAAGGYWSLVSNAGDVNGDGLGDLLIGAMDYDHGGDGAGAAYVLFGKPTSFETVWLKDIAASAAGIKLVGQIAGEGAGIDVAAAGDLNGDGFGDVLIAALHGNRAGDYAGAVYAVYGWSVPMQTGSADGDRLLGSAVADRLFGMAGRDSLIGGAGGDQVEGNDGDDVLFGNGGNDGMAGGNGRDTFHGGLGDDTIDGGAGCDAAAFGAAAQGVSVDLAAGTASGQGDDRLIGIEEVFGSRYDDEIRGDAGDNWFTGGAGNDTLDGRGGRDTASYADAEGGVSVDLAAGTASGRGEDRLIGIEALIGSRFDDEIRGDAGNDWLTGGGGNDTLDGREGRDVACYGTADGGVTVDLAAGTAAGQGEDRLFGIEGVIGGRFDDDIGGSAGDNWLAGGGGNDAICGGDGRDTVLGGTGDDRLDGGDGSDWLLGGAGADVFRFAPQGIAGDDVDTIADFTSGEDRIDLQAFGFADLNDVLALLRADGTGLVLDLGSAGGPEVILTHVAALQAGDLLI